MLNNETFYNQNTINIFTDASLCKLDFVTYVCSGAVAIIGGNTNNIIDSEFRISVGTNNAGEATGIFLATVLVQKLKPYYPNAVFNIFSDSKIAVFGIRDWSNAWLNKSLTKINRDFINSEGNPVANQEIFKKIMFHMSFYKLAINFYHIKGHVTNSKELIHAIHVFKSSNGISLNKNVMTVIAKMNDLIDNMTRKKLHAENLRNIYPYPNLYSFAYPTTVSDIKTFRELKNYRGI